MITDPEVDFRGIAEMLQRENETLRLHILKLRYQRHTPLSVLTNGSARQFLISNYLVIAAVGTLLFIVLSLMETVKGIVKR